MKWHFQFIACVLVFPLLLPDVSAGQHHHQSRNDASVSASRLVETIDVVRNASSRYHDVDAAIASGYRLVGPDFPGMGEHWVNIRQVVQRDLDLANPAVLSYVEISGEKILTGVAYTWPLKPNEVPPEFIQPDLWHSHTGSIDEETLVLNPQGMHTRGEDRPQLAMIHAWVWVDNPTGTFEQDNWALPFLRLGLPVPERPSPQSGKALYLLSGGVDYYLGLIELAGTPSQREIDLIREVLEGFSSRVAGWYADSKISDTISEDDVAFLTECWIDMWSDIEDRVSATLWSSVKPLAF